MRHFVPVQYDAWIQSSVWKVASYCTSPLLLTARWPRVRQEILQDIANNEISAILALLGPSCLVRNLMRRSANPRNLGENFLSRLRIWDFLMYSARPGFSTYSGLGYMDQRWLRQSALLALISKIADQSQYSIYWANGSVRKSDILYLKDRLCDCPVC